MQKKNSDPELGKATYWSLEISCWVVEIKWKMTSETTPADPV